MQDLLAGPPVEPGPGPQPRPPAVGSVEASWHPLPADSSSKGQGGMLWGLCALWRVVEGKVLPSAAAGLVQYCACAAVETRETNTTRKTAGSWIAAGWRGGGALLRLVV